MDARHLHRSKRALADIFQPDHDNWQSAIKNSPRLEFQSKVLTPGNRVVFSGSSQCHYRDALPHGKSTGFCDLLFFHYIPKGASEIVAPRNWARLFGVPELASIAGVDAQCLIDGGEVNCPPVPVTALPSSTVVM